MTEQLDLKLSAAGIARLYLWDMLQAQYPNVWKTLAGGVPPIIPAQDQPETQVSDSPYIVYVSDILPTTDLYQYQRESFQLRIFSSSTSTLNQTTRLINRLFNKWDVTARDINRWMQHPDGRSSFPEEWLDEVDNFQFKTVRVVSGVGIEPSGGEGERMDTSMSIELAFIEKKMGLPKPPVEGRFYPEGTDPSNPFA